MVRFLLNRPIAVLMSFLACVIVGWVTYATLPVSLLPDIAIPEITVQVSSPNTSARELENTVVRNLRGQLIQTARMRGLDSEVRDGSGVIRLHFDYGVNIDLAFIEVNEKIDAAMNSLPRDTERPKVIKASATDVPVFYLHLTLKEKGDDQAFITLCDFAESVIRRRIEQLVEVSMVDVTGMVERRLQVVPDRDKLAMLGLSIQDIEGVLMQNNVEPGSMSVRDGYYRYNVKFSSLLRTEADVQNILLNKNGRIFRLGDFCRVETVPAETRGMSVVDGKRAVTLAIIKQADENMDDLKRAVAGTMHHFRYLYPDIDFSISRNQTELLDYTISNLRQNLLLGFIFIFLVAILFLGDVKSPFIIAVSMVASVLICFLFFYLFDKSLNIISLAGLILALGMMIDSSIVVTENISQYRERGYGLKDACIAGTSEVVTPMLSSSLTTVAVFVPLVFLSGIAGAIFFDQAFAVTVGLMVSYFTGIMLLPVLYYLVYSIRWKWSRRWSRKPARQAPEQRGRERHPFALPTARLYDTGIDWVFSHKRVTLLFCALSLPLCVWMFYAIPTERMPAIDHSELMVHIDWNENIHIDENRARIDSLFAAVRAATVERTAAIGRQDYLLNRDDLLTETEAEVYLRTARPDEIAPLQAQATQWLRSRYPNAVVTFSPPETVFEKIFATGEADVVAALYRRNGRGAEVDPQALRRLETQLAEETGHTPTGIAFDNQLNIRVNGERLLLYGVSFDEIYRTLKTAFRENQVTLLHSFSRYLPIVVAGEARTINDVLRETLVRTAPDNRGVTGYIPLRELVSVSPAEDLKTITAGTAGEYIPLRFYDVKDADRLIARTRQVMASHPEWETTFSGSYFSNRQMLNELVVVLLISVLLMYFILAAQFESFLQPLIVLLEIPVDVAFALVVLWGCGHTLNLMSAIGLVVTCGIIINDSILKLDAINELRKQGTPLLEAIHEAGRRRLRPIIMTSLTTIFAMVPLLFSSDMGSELQAPLAIAMIATMSIGTLVSLFVIPLVYWITQKRHAAERV
jgi:multidrug efflux pump subunit AcrB